MASTLAFVRLVGFASFLGLEFQKGIDLAREHRQLAARQVQRVVAGRGQERAIVRDDHAGLRETAQEMLQENLRAQVEEVRRLVEQQQIWLMQKQSRELQASLPAARELGHRPFEVGPFEFELAGDFAAFPVGLVAVAHQEVEPGFARQKGIVLPQIAEPQLRMADYLAPVQLFIAQQDAQQGAFAGAIAAHESQFHVIDDRGFGGRRAAPDRRRSSERS